MVSIRSIGFVLTGLMAACDLPPAANDPTPTIITQAGPNKLTGVAENMENPRDRIKSGEYLLMIQGEINEVMLKQLLADYQLTSIRKVGAYYLITVNKDPGLATVEALCRQLTGFKSIQPNYSYRLPTPR